MWCGVVLGQRACLRGGGGAEQGRSRHRTITPVRGARPSDGPHFKVPRATSICRRLQGIASLLRQSVPFRYMRTAMATTTSVRRCSQDAAECCHLFRHIQHAPAPASAVTADLIRVEVLNVALSWAPRPSPVAEVNTRGQQMGERLNNDYAELGCRALSAHPCPLTPAGPAGGVGVPVSNPTCSSTCAITTLPCLMAALQRSFNQGHLTRLSSLASTA
jgi:hypothetical protein